MRFSIMISFIEFEIDNKHNESNIQLCLLVSTYSQELVRLNMFLSRYSLSPWPGKSKGLIVVLVSPRLDRRHTRADLTKACG
jgi:hypothetical protein